MVKRSAIFVLAFFAALPLARPAKAAPDPAVDNISLWKADFDLGESCLANNPRSQARYSHYFRDEDCEPIEPSTLRGSVMLVESHMHDDELSRIYQRHLTSPCDSTTPPRRFGGKLVLSIRIESDGTVSEATLVSSTTHCPAFNEAVRQNVKSWRYPQSNGASYTHMVWKFSKYPPPPDPMPKAVRMVKASDTE